MRAMRIYACRSGTAGAAGPGGVVFFGGRFGAPVRGVESLLIAASLVALALLPGAGAAPVGLPLTLALSGPGTVSLGAPAQYAAFASGGAPPYLFAWTWNGTPVHANTSAPGNTSTLTLLPRGNAIYTLVVIVTDHAGNSTSQRATVTVTGPGPVTVALRLTGEDNSGAVHLDALAGGGTAPYTYRWTGPGAPARWVSSANLTSAPLGSGTFNFSVIARDANGFSAGASLEVRASVHSAAGGIPGYDYLALGLAVALVATLVGGYVLRGRRRPPALSAAQAAGEAPPTRGA
jgi:hypothetical protein